MSNVPETYLYEVRPVGRPIVLDHGVEIKTRKSLYLTKEDVQKCLETAYVFRRFASLEPVRVNTTNLDRIHRANYIPEEEWNNKNDTATSNKPTSVSQTTNCTSQSIPEVVESDIVEESTEIPEEVTEPNGETTVDFTCFPMHSEEVDKAAEHLLEQQEVEVVSETEDVDVEEEVEEEDEDSSIEDDSIAELAEDNETGVSIEESSQPTQNNNHIYRKHPSKRKHQK